MSQKTEIWGIWIFKISVMFLSFWLLVLKEIWKFGWNPYLPSPSDIHIKEKSFPDGHLFFIYFRYARWTSRAARKTRHTGTMESHYGPNWDVFLHWAFSRYVRFFGQRKAYLSTQKWPNKHVWPDSKQHWLCSRVNLWSCYQVWRQITVFQTPQKGQ